jgi:hypothetical protein
MGIKSHFRYSCYTPSNSKITDKLQIRKELDGCSSGLFEILSQHLPEETDEDHEQIRLPGILVNIPSEHILNTQLETNLLHEGTTKAVFAFFNLRIILTEKMELHMKF